MDEHLTDAELLEALSPVERALAIIALDREAKLAIIALDREAKQAAEPRPYHKPTWHELWEAGWIEPPYCPLPANLLRELREAHRDLRPRSWVLFSPDADAVLLMLLQREPGLLRHKVTKKWGHMWRLAKPNKGDQP